MAGKMAYLSQEEKQKIRNALKIKKSLDKEEDSHNLRASSPESEDVDFKNVIHPLSYYIHDREQMMEEMFSIIKGDKLRKMLPPILKNYTLEEIKADCLVHLLGMSKKRILAIIEGRELHSSSDSESESSSTTGEPDEAPKSPTSQVESRSNMEDDDLLDISISEKDIDSLMKDKPADVSKSKKPRTRMKKKIKIEKDVSLFSIVISDDDLDEKSSKKQKKMNREHASNKLDKILGSKEKAKKHRKIGTRSKSNANTDKGRDVEKLDKDDAASLDKNDKGKTLLEILELEMRARAIRALLKNTNEIEEGGSVLSDAVKSTADAATKSDPKIVSAIAEAIDQSLSDKNAAEPNDDSDPDDVEIIDDVDLCVLIDDDDDICTETNSEVPAPQTNVNEKSDPPGIVSEKEKPVAADVPEKSISSNDDAEISNKDGSSKNKPLQADSENDNPSANDSDKSNPSKDDLAKNKPVINDSAISKTAKDNLEKRKPSPDNLGKKKLSNDSPETKTPLQDDSRKRKLSINESEKSKSSTDVSEKRKTSAENSEKSQPLADDSGKSKPLEDEISEKLTSSSSEKLQSLPEKGAKNCESGKERDLEMDSDKCDLTRNDAPENAEELTKSTDNMTWSERWADKQNVKEVVKNSKMCANIRKRMRFALMLKQKQSEKSKEKVNEIDIGDVEESSVAHYNLIKAHTSRSVDNPSSDDSKVADKQSDPTVETSEEAPENDDADITTADHTLTILESDPKSLIIDISDDEVIPNSPSCDNS